MPDGLRLFLIEDDDDFAFLMCKSLERAGHEVTVCRSGSDALIVLSQNQFDLVLLDQLLQPGDMSGLELLQTLNKEGNGTPVVMVTGKGDQKLVTQALRAGALDYIVKDVAMLADLPRLVQESVNLNRLRQTNRLLVEALESARDGIAITDLQGKMLHINGALERMMGYERRELIGQNPRMFRSGLHPVELFDNLWRTILARSSWQGELVNRKKDGTHLETSLTVSPILDHRGQLTNFVGIFRDITERKKMERQLFQAQKMQSVGTLAGGVAHEFNNLLAGIQGYATLGMREEGVPKSVYDFLEFIVNLSDRAAHLTRQLLAFARKPALSRQPTSLHKLMSETADFVRRSLSLEVQFESPPTTPNGEFFTALADANQLQQVLVNLALNARDALVDRPKKPILFRLRRQILGGELPAFPQNVPPGDYVVLEIEDQGSGMPQEVLAQALDPFFTTKDVGLGTGLGLPVAFGILNGHQGFLTIDTVVGAGTRVGLYLPRLEQAARLEETRTPGTYPQPNSTAGRSILVIDDEQAVLDVVRRFLQIAGHTVMTADSGARGMELLSRGVPPDLVILDWMIPHEDGLTNFKALRARFSRLPILVCTGLVQPDQALQLLQENSVELLRKPFRMNELWFAVNKALPTPLGSTS